jgi:peptidoglycan/LPS O-acetylase OafA/YrhL
MSPLAGLILLFMPSTPRLGQRLGFRPDIQGLRAVAVSLVLLFHFQLMGFGFGFIGVDLFFVISGYLMTGILLQYQQINVNTYLQFFASRAIRILPALVMLVCGMYLLGYFFLPSAEYQELSKEIKKCDFI